MVFSNFRAQCVVRSIILALTIFLSVLLFSETGLLISAAVTAFLALLEILALIRYIERTNRDVARFLDSIRQQDFTQSFVGAGKGKSFKRLASAFNAVMEDFRKTRSEREGQYHFLQAVVQHVGIALLAFRDSGDVVLINTPAKRLFKISHLRNIESLDSIDRAFSSSLYGIKNGEKRILKIDSGSLPLQLAIYATNFRLQDENVKLVSIQDIRGELEEKEMEAWQNLIRVLTHEIMNSITPIASMSSTVDDLLSGVGRAGNGEILNEETLKDIQSAAQTIRRRSEGLMKFIASYRSLTSVPRPEFRIFRIDELFSRVGKLVEERLRSRSIEFRAGVNPLTLELSADPALVEQVLINLILNAAQALEGSGRTGEIVLNATMDAEGKILIAVSDNGPGIAPDLMEKIFIPFFTTRKEGSGIGLSLSRQIMRLHGGTISASSVPEAKTVFTLKF